MFVIACAGFSYVFSIDAADDDADDYNGTVEVVSQSVGGYAPPAQVTFHWDEEPDNREEVEDMVVSQLQEKWDIGSVITE